MRKCKRKENINNKYCELLTSYNGSVIFLLSPTPKKPTLVEKPLYLRHNPNGQFRPRNNIKHSDLFPDGSPLLTAGKPRELF